jgi:predicted anti-sigma-YlaC factor YlaD
MLTCQELTELVTDYLEGHLPLRQELSFRMHVSMCKDCRAYLRQTKMTIRTLGRLPQDPMPANVRDELLARFRDTQPRVGVRNAVPSSVRLLATIERMFAGRRAWLASGTVFLAAAVVLLVSRLRSGPLGEGSRCLMMELGAGIVPVTMLGLIASAKRTRISVGAFAIVGMISGFAAFVVLQWTCPMSHVALHVLAFHFGGIVYAGLAGIAEARVLALR